jgi:hypothetical protein
MFLSAAERRTAVTHSGVGAVPARGARCPSCPIMTQSAALNNDDLWNCGGGLVWGFAPGWSLRPTFEYNWEESTITSLAYSSTEFWLTVRKSF